MSRICQLLWLCAFGILVLSGFSGAVKIKDVNLQLYRTMSNYRDLEVNPCDNFYRYACGNWKTVHDNDNYYETLGLLDYKANYEFARILRLYKRKRHSQPYVFMRHVLNYYETCKNMSRQPYEPGKYLRWLQRHENLTFPVGPNMRLDYDWLHLLAVLRKYGLNGVFWEDNVIQHRHNSRQWHIDLDKPTLSDEFKSLPTESLQVFLHSLGVTHYRPWRKLWRRIRLFEAQLQELDSTEDEMGYQYVALKELNSRWISRYLSIALEDTQLSQKNVRISIQNMQYLSAVQKLLASYDGTFIGVYIGLRFLTHIDSEGPQEFTHTWCVRNTRSLLPLAMNWLYEEYHADVRQEGEQIREIFNILLQQFRLMIRLNKNGFNESVVQFLEDKSNIGLKIGNLPRHATTYRIEVFYENLTLHNTSFYENHLKLLYFGVKSRHNLLNKRMDGKSDNDDYFHLEDTETGASSSPYFLTHENLVIVPLTLLQLPLFHSGLHSVFKYSSIGFLLAHEITHAFDDSGIDFNKLGNMEQPAAGAIRANENFLLNVECLRRGAPEVIDEKIADVNGLRLTFDACFNNLENRIEEGIAEIDSAWVERLFFLNFALFFCGDNKAAYADDVHGTDEQRVIDTLSNFAEFSRVYQCPLGSTMNPATKCQVWR